LISATEAHREIDTAAFDSLLDMVDGVSFVDDERSAPSSA
jgi:hypothetical protein